MDRAPPPFDLSFLMQELLSRPMGPAHAAGNALKELKDGKSALHDLAYAAELVDFLLIENPRTEDARVLPPSARGTFLSSAILLYARATQPSQQRAGAGRKHLNVRKGLSKEFQDLHDKLDTLRNKAIAHLDQDRPFGDKQFAEEILLLVSVPGGNRFELADRRVVFQEGLERQIRDLLQAAIEVGRQIVHERTEAASRLVIKVLEAEPQLTRLFTNHPFDAVKFFGTEEYARSFIDTGSPTRTPLDVGDEIIFEGWPDPVARA